MKRYNHKLGSSSRKNLVGVHASSIDILELALTLSPIDMGVPKDGGKRTAERQNELFLDPNIATKCDGYKNISNHQYGLSFDIFAYVNGKASWDPRSLATCAVAIVTAGAILGYVIEWGGLWPWDKPHFNIVGQWKDGVYVEFEKVA